MAANLPIAADPTNVLSTFRILRDENAKTQRALVDSARRAAEAIAQSYDKARESALRSSAQRESVERRVNETRSRLARQANQVVEREVQMGVTAEEIAAQRKEGVYRRLAQTYVRTEQQKTQATEREERKRAALLERARRDVARRAGEVVGGAGRIAGAVANDIFGQIGGVRQTVASRQRLINGALFQAGITGGGAASAHRQIQQFLGSAEGRGISGDDLAQALNRTQTEFSALSRPGGLASFLRNASFARDTYQDVGEVTRVGAMLGNAGLDEGTQHSTLLALTGMAQRGAIELGDVTRTAMAPLQRRIALATANVAPGDAAGRAHATQQAVLQTFAEMEVGRGLGMTPRALGNATAAMEGALASDVTQQRMLGNIQNAAGLSEQKRRELVGQLFATDSHGRQRLRGEYQTTFGLAGALTQAGINTTQAANIFSGGGHGNPMSLQRNWRNTLTAFMGEGNEQVARMMQGVGRDFTEQNVAEGRAMNQAELQTKITEQNEQHINALMQNTAALNAFDAVMEYRAKNPVEAATVRQVGGDAGEIAAAVANRATGGGTVNQRVRHMDAEQRAAAEGGTRFWYFFGGAQAARSHDPQFDQRTQRIEAQLAQGSVVELGPNSLAAMQRDPHDAVHGVSSALSGANAPPPEARNR